jgi:hypothetical protein
LINDAIARGIPGDFTFDSYFTSAKVLNHIESTKRGYVGDLKLNRKVVYEGREQSLQAVARQLPWQTQKPVRVGNRRYGYFRKQMRLPAVKHPVRSIGKIQPLFTRVHRCLPAPRPCPVQSKYATALVHKSLWLSHLSCSDVSSAPESAILEVRWGYWAQEEWRVSWRTLLASRTGSLSKSSVVTDAHHVHTGAQSAGMNRPCGGRRLYTAQIVAVEVAPHEPIQGRAAGAYAGQGEASFGSRNAQAHMAEPGAVIPSRSRM